MHDLDREIEQEFGALLAVHGFRIISQRKWIREQKFPIRELFVLNALKGGQYSPVWGFSSGIAPYLRGRRFIRQSDEEAATMDLLIDPIDVTGSVPREAFSFITGENSDIPADKIHACAKHFVPLALADFDGVHSVQDFCQKFLERSRANYARFPFDAYTQHRLVMGFVMLRTGRRELGLNAIQKFCESTGAKYDDSVLVEYIRDAINE